MPKIAIRIVSLRRIERACSISTPPSSSSLPSSPSSFWDRTDSPTWPARVGGYWRTLNDYRMRMESHVRDSMPDLPSSTEIARLARSPSALLDHLSAMGTDTDTETADVEQYAARPESPLSEPALPGDPGLN